MSDYIVCESCGTQLNPKLQSVYQRVSGWVKLRGAGGANAISHRAAEPRFRCKGCIDGADQDDSPWKQGELF